MNFRTSRAVGQTAGGEDAGNGDNSDRGGAGGRLFSDDDAYGAIGVARSRTLEDDSREMGGGARAGLEARGGGASIFCGLLIEGFT